jgi:hypothetical protein
MKRGRKAIYKSEGLQIGEQTQLPRTFIRFQDQNMYNIRKREPGKSFELVRENRKLFLKRVA